MVAAETIAAGYGSGPQADARRPILEARELRKIYGPGSLGRDGARWRESGNRRRRDGGDHGAFGDGKKHFVAPAGRARQANKRCSILRRKRAGIGAG